MRQYTKYLFEKVNKPNRNTFRSYDGVYYDGKQLILSKLCQFSHSVVDIYTDAQAGAIKLTAGTSFKKNRSNRISVSGLNVPKGRYERVPGTDEAIYRRKS